MQQKNLSINTTQTEVLTNTDISTNGAPLLQCRPQSGITRPDNITKEFKEIDIDLNTLFAHLDKTDQAITRYQRLHQAVIENLSGELKVLTNQIEDIEDKLLHPYDAKAYRELFHDSSSLETDSDYYDDNIVDLDLLQEGIRLPLMAKENVLLNPYGNTTGQIEIMYQAGSELDQLKSSACSLDMAIDADPNTFWAASIMTDEPFSLEWPEYFNTKNGALIKLQITLESMQTINEIIIRPFTVYPLDIVALIAYNTDSLIEEGTVLLKPGNSVIEPLVCTLEDTPIKRLVLILNQRHYICKDLIVSKLEQEKQKSLINIDSVNLNKFMFKPVINDMITEKPLLASLMIGPLSDVENIAKEQIEQRTQVTKYQYDYGLKGVELNRLSHYQTGLYVSKAIGSSGSIREIKLYTNEIHQEANLANRIPFQVTSIEYWIGDKNNWFPIIPINHDQITNELLDISFNHDTHQFEVKLRFPAKNIVRIREDGTIIASNKYQLQKDTQTLVFNSATYKAGSIYTIDYIPSSGQVIYFNQDEIKYNETFNGTNENGQITLSHIPYINRTLINKVLNENPDWNPSILESYICNNGTVLNAPVNISIRFADGITINQPVKPDDLGLKNRTDYGEGQNKMDTFIQDESNYQYTLEGAIIKFNTSIPKNAIIDVEYGYCRDSIRLKAKLRRTLASSLSYTPILKDYTIYLNTIK